MVLLRYPNTFATHWPVLSVYSKTNKNSAFDIQLVFNSRKEGK